MNRVDHAMAAVNTHGANVILYRPGKYYILIVELERRKFTLRFKSLKDVEEALELLEAALKR